MRVKGEDGSVHLETRTEQLDEESAADGFRKYLARRMAGSFAEEPRPFRKLFGLISRIRHLRDSRAATERLATNAEEALYDAFLAGKYRHVRDLTFAEPVAPKAEAGAGTEAPQTGAKPVDGKPSVTVPSREQVLAQDKANGTEVAEIGDLVKGLAKTGKPAQGGQRHYRLAKTSDALKAAGLTGDYFTIKSGVIFKHYGKDADHVLTPEDWASISASLADPLVVSRYSRKGKDGKILYPENSYRVWTEAVINGKYAMVGVEVKSPGKEITVNAITTVYGDEHVSLRESDVVYSRGNGEGIRTLLNGPNSRQYSGSPAAPEIVSNPVGEGKGETPAPRVGCHKDDYGM